MLNTTLEAQRLEADRTQNIPWKKWGPYLSERQWGTVREDYSPYGSAWDYFSHDQARSRSYRWGEDGIGGMSDDQQRLCFAIALWNGVDPILKERLFGLTGPEGNHGEDVKEYYFYLDNTPTHSYQKMLYKYPQAAFPYAQLVAENRQRSRRDFEFELLDTGVFNENRYFDITIEYAKAAPEDIWIRLSATNRGPQVSPLHLLPTLWFRNTWSWDSKTVKPVLKAMAGLDGPAVEALHPTLGQYRLYCGDPLGAPALLFTENETNQQQLFGGENRSPYVKDGIHQAVVNQQPGAVNPDQTGTKVAAHYAFEILPGETQVVYLRLCHEDAAVASAAPFSSQAEQVFQQRQQDANDFYQQLTPFAMTEDLRQIQRQAFAGMLWSKQYYYYSIEDWLRGDPAASPPPERRQGRNRQWPHLDAQDILSMPDTWEYPWFAAWDLAFHTLPLAMVDPEFAKYQLDVITREWYMHPNGQLPAYEWAFGDVNPPVHAWATWRVYKIEQKIYGRQDRQFLERVFQKLLLNFTWWVNRKDVEGNNVFEGGFLGLDNIGVFDRSAPLPTGGRIEQSDGTSWMAMYCLNLLTIALELALENPVYEDIATKFFEHFIYIAAAMDQIGSQNNELWDEDDGFFYDVLELPGGESIRLKVRSMVGLIPLFAVTTIEPELLNRLPAFKERLEWFVQHRPHLVQNIASFEKPGVGQRRLLAIANPEKLKRILAKMLDEQEFLSPYGIRALSRYHASHPYLFNVNGTEYRVDYEPAESSTGLFGGNSNWRGPIWMPVNYLLIESLQKFYHYLGDDFKVACPSGDQTQKTLWEVAMDLSQRLIAIFQPDAAGHRPVYGGITRFQTDPHWRDLILFHEYFQGDNGAGIGASHQTGWTGLIAKLIQQSSEYADQPQDPDAEVRLEPVSARP
ncbi:MGH1-like glycoside hydrolase domain-containing protein [Lyngbya confervoides]|uniref:Glucosidase n=1 Tax=Lyngbya confervoides BDU141951 TaxID=1574623 RepID=A0ABD4SWP7_9CYAN|nr:glucosidase [Lyngbya confervoides]MCM1981227.1 glucosidase [Lyngbya confervoides BDU141951]